MGYEKKRFEDLVIFDGAFFNLHQDWECPIPGFFILAAKRDIRSIADFTEDESTEFIFLLQKTRKGVSDVLGIHDVYLFQNEDTEHGFHFWIFPRHEWMEKFGRKIQSVRPIMNYATENRFTDDTIVEVTLAVEKMREFMNP